MSREIVTNKLRIKNIPAIICHKKEARQLPLLIFSHGFSRSKEDFMEEMKLYAENDIFTVSIDNKSHGERDEIPFFKYAMENEKLNILKVRKLINETSKDIPAVINFFENNDMVDTGRTGMYGVSMGGFTIFRAVTLEKRIKVASVFISSPVWDEIPAGAQFADTEELRKELKEYSNGNSPVNFINQFYDRNILIQNGRDDNHFDPEKVRSFVRTVQKHNPGKITLIEYEDTGHEYTAEMQRKAFNWIKEVL